MLIDKTQLSKPPPVSGDEIIEKMEKAREKVKNEKRKSV